MRRALTTLAVALAVVATSVTGCGDDAPPAREDAGLAPAFEREASTSPSTSTSTTNVVVGGGTDTVVPGSTAGGTMRGSGAQALIADPAGDATPSPVDPAPAWTDLLGARMTRSEGGFELRVRLAGGDAPEGSGSGDHTMNLASFYDVDGDGEIDFEIWANLADGGWDGSYFDETGEGLFGEASFVEVSTEGDEVVLRFALRHLDGAERFRWSIASEWGRYEAVGTPAMVRDEAPDDDGAAAFPGA